MKYFTLLSTTVWILLNSACTHMPMPITSTEERGQHRQHITNVVSWRIVGKLGFKSSTSSGIASLNWKQDSRQYEVNLRGPFGTGHVSIVGNEQSVRIKQSRETYIGSPEDLAQQLILPVPLNTLVWWVRGLPSPHQRAARQIIRTPEDIIVSFEQAGWQLLFDRYLTVGNYTLPSKISGQRDDMSFKLTISKWYLPKG